MVWTTLNLKMAHLRRVLADQNNSVTSLREFREDECMDRSSDVQLPNGKQGHVSVLTEIYEILASVEEGLLHQKTITMSFRAVINLVTELDRMSLSEGQITHTVLSQLKSLVRQRKNPR